MRMRTAVFTPDRSDGRGTAMWEDQAAGTERPTACWSPATQESTLGPVTEQTGAEVRAIAADAARQARGVLAALADPDDELTATAAMRHRLEGAAVALETLASQPDAPGKRLPGR